MLTRHEKFRNRGLGPLGPRNWILALAFAVGLTALAGPSAAQTGRAYDLESVVALLQGGVAETRILTLVNSDCIGFDLTQDAARRLRSAGASAQFVGDLSLACRGFAGRSRQPQVQRAPVAPGARDARAPWEVASFGHLAVAFQLAGEESDPLPWGVEFALGIGWQGLGVRGSAGILGGRRIEPTMVRAVPDTIAKLLLHAGADVVLMPSAPMYLFGGATALATGDIIPHGGVGFRPFSDGLLMMEVKVHRTFPLFWQDGMPLTQGPVLTLLVGLGGHSFGSR